MIKLKQLFESSIRDRLKARIKNTDTEEVRRVARLGDYLGRVKRLYKRDPEEVKRNYERFIKNYIKKHPREGDYYSGILGLLSLATLRDSRVKYPSDTKKAISQINSEMGKIVQAKHIPEEFDLETVAYFLRFLEKYDFEVTYDKLQGIESDNRIGIPNKGFNPLHQ